MQQGSRLEVVPFYRLGGVEGRLPALHFYCGYTGRSPFTVTRVPERVCGQ